MSNEYDIRISDRPYELGELIAALEVVRAGGGPLNFPRAIYTLALEIKKINEALEAQDKCLDKLYGIDN